MEIYSGKTLEEAIEKACQAMGVSAEELNYQVVYEKKTLFQKRVDIEAWSMKTVENFIENYLRTLLDDMEFENEIAIENKDGRIYVDLNTSNNSILIGKGGVILRALNFIVKTAVSNTFKRRIELSIDINGYKQDRYHKVASMAMRLGKSVQRNHVDVKLDPMPGDERKIIHTTLANMDHVRTESFGEGRDRYLCIIYDPDKKAVEPEA